MYKQVHEHACIFASICDNWAVIGIEVIVKRIDEFVEIGYYVLFDFLAGRYATRLSFVAWTVDRGLERSGRP